MILAEVAYNIWPVLLTQLVGIIVFFVIAYFCQVPGNQTDPLSPQDQARGRSQAGPGRLAGLDNFHLYAIRNKTIIPGINPVFVVF